MVKMDWSKVRFAGRDFDPIGRTRQAEARADKKLREASDEDVHRMAEMAARKAGQVSPPRPSFVQNREQERRRAHARAIAARHNATLHGS